LFVQVALEHSFRGLTINLDKTKNTIGMAVDWKNGQYSESGQKAKKDVDEYKPDI